MSKTNDEQDPPGGASVEGERSLKIRRGQLKGALTRVLNNIEMSMSEDDVDDVKRLLEAAKIKFKDFQSIHDAYAENLVDDDEYLKSEEYYEEKAKHYITVVKLARAWVQSRVVKKEEKVEPREDSQQEIMKIMNLPKVELEPFDGDPLKFHAFLATFDENVHDVITNGKMRLSRILQYTTGKAKDAIRSCSLLGGEDGYLQARKILTTRFGDDHIVAEYIIANLKNGKPVRTQVELRQFADELLNGHATLDRMKQLFQVDNQSCIISIADRLQPYIRNRWKRHAVDMKRDSNKYPEFKGFVEFISRQADEANDPVYGSWNAPKNDGKMTGSRNSKSGTSFSTNTSQLSQPKKKGCILCGQDHRLFWCTKFKAMKPTERLKLVIDNKLCRNCLLDNHDVSSCRKPSVCTVCGEKHTRFIHIPADQASGPVTSQGSRGANVHRVEATSRETSSDVCIPLVEVTVDEKEHVLALLDTGSNTTFCTRSLLNNLGKRGVKARYTLNTLSKSQDVKETEIVNLELKSKCGHMKLENVYVVDQIPVANPSVDVSDYVHLSDLPVVVNGEVHILIGQDHAEGLLPLEVRKGNTGEPFAVRTVLGWSVNGPLRSVNNVGKQVVTNFVMTDQSYGSISDDMVPHDKLGLSVEDRKVLKLWDEQSKLVNGHYQVPIPIKVCDVQSNLVVAQSRLESLKRNLDKKGWYDKYKQEIEKLLIKGYAERVSVKLYDVNKNVWYLPHHAVTSVNKPGKIRVVFDCASKYLGKSLNDMCMGGPDMINNLQHVFLRFRNYEYAISADIEAMYYQVTVPENQRDLLRFLWLRDDGAVDHYRMCENVFGGVWSGSAASYALKKTVNDFDVSDSVYNVVQDSFYVDDCLLSVSSMEQATEIIHGVKDVLKCGGFNLTKFVVNHPCLLSSIDEVDRAVEVKDLTSDVSSKVLGTQWQVKSDTLHYCVNLCEPQTVSRRSMLSVVSSLYDPLGLIAPVPVVGRLLFQEVTRLKLDWDDLVPMELENSWLRWLGSLDELTKVVLPRCTIPKGFEDAYMELHHFSDSSSSAYGCCSYLRCVSKSGQIKVSLIYGKGRVAPLKGLSIPRLELQAAVVAARVDSMLREQLKLHLGPSTFWVDSEIVLRYIQNESRRFQVFVANRVGEIRGLTEPQQWRHIPGDINPADIVSRGIEASRLMDSIWFTGPEFLHSHKDQWKSEEQLHELTDDDPEVKQVKLVSHVVDVSQDAKDDPIDALIDHFSDWYRLKRALCWLIRCRNRLQGKSVDDGSLSVREIQDAENVLIRHIQGKFYPNEIGKLSRGEIVGKGSHIRDLQPVLLDGLLRVGGRIRNASVEFDQKFPIILPSKSKIANLIAREAHEIAHLGVEWSLSRLRSKYWITHGRAVLRRIKDDCVVCRKLYAPPCSQKMANLPVDRLTAGNPPFSMVATDCFGPMLVKVGRSQAKRYGCIFTCMATRAVHVEILELMDTNSMINALRRFMSRRGTPVKILSDLGTNFVGANNELSSSVKQLEKSRIYDFCVKQNVQWVFNPPCAPHMAGVVERMVQTVKRVFNAMLQNARLTDEILRTLMCEAESLINSRPITKVSSDSTDLSALTPNHLLLLRSTASPLPGEFCVADVYRRRWRHVQHLADVFWSRWLNEYLPMLQKIAKWHNSERNIQVNDIVLVVGEATPRNLWPMGIVTQVKKSDDGLVRSVHVKTKATELVRPITKLVLLEGNN